MFTIIFVICKLLGVLSLSWWWLILTIFLDGGFGGLLRRRK